MLTVVALILQAAFSFSILNLNNQKQLGPLPGSDLKVYSHPDFPWYTIRAKRGSRLCDTTVDQVSQVNRFMATWTQLKIGIFIFGSLNLGRTPPLIPLFYG